MQLQSLLILIFGHIVTDTSQGALPALLPLLKEIHGLSYAEAGALLMTMNLTSSVIQPLFGFLTDRWNLRWLVPLGVAVSGVGFGLIGLLSGYVSILAAVVLCGLGVASFHPESFKAVLNSAGSRKVVGVSWFMVGGNLGMALGPAMVTAYCAWLGLPGIMLFAIPGVITSLLFLAHWRSLAKRAENLAVQAPSQALQAIGNRVRPFAILVAAVILRSWIHAGIATFVPFYYVSALGGDPLTVGTLLSVFLGAGVVGTLLGAPLAERIGPKRFFIISVALVTPLMVWLLNAQGAWLYIVMALIGALLLSTWSVIMVLGQQIMPDRAGTSSGLLVGFALGTGGMGAAALGVVADHWGVVTVMHITTLMPLACALAACFIPVGQKSPARSA
ncbi:hypothetical protein AAU61_11560 [Desulfocarbo indianensis]|nr:hypothetical protein AAU61_11560 [Desulfocarbo indianensis]